MSFKLKIMLAVCAAGILSALVATIVSVRSISNEGEFGLLEKSRAILNRIQITSEYIAQQGGLNRTVEYMQAKYPDGNLPKEAKLDVLKQVPVFAAMQVGMTDAKSDAYSFRVFSNEPRRKENMATAAEMEIFNRFERDPNLKEWTETTEDDVRVFRPVRLSESQGCLVCHGNPQNSPGALLSCHHLPGFGFGLLLCDESRASDCTNRRRTAGGGRKRRPCLG